MRISRLTLSELISRQCPVAHAAFDLSFLARALGAVKTQNAIVAPELDILLLLQIREATMALELFAVAAGDSVAGC